MLSSIGGVWCRLFQTRGAATANALSPNFLRVCGGNRLPLSADRDEARDGNCYNCDYSCNNKNHNSVIRNSSVPISLSDSQTINHNYTGRSGLVVSASDCGVKGPRFKSHRGRLRLSRQPLRYTALGTGCAPLLQCLGQLSLLPSVGW